MRRYLREGEIDLFASLYWLNSLEGTVSYRVNRDWRVGLEYLYLWDKLTDRWSNISGPGIGGNSSYRFSGHALSLSATKGAPARWFSITLGYVQTSGVYEELVSLRAYADTVYSVPNRGNGLILSSELGKNHTLSSHCDLVLAAGARLGVAKETWNGATYPIQWLSPINVRLAGVYLKIGVLATGGLR
jgi:hypothetical protein